MYKFLEFMSKPLLCHKTIIELPLDKYCLKINKYRLYKQISAIRYKGRERIGFLKKDISFYLNEQYM